MINFFKKKPKKVSLLDMAEKVRKIANDHGEGFYKVQVQIHYFNNDEEPPVITVKGYINNIGLTKNHPCIEDVCKELIEKADGGKEVKNKILDVTF